MIDLEKLLAELVSCRSVTPDQAGALDIAENTLKSVGYETERLPKADVDNLFVKFGSGEPSLLFAGHIDVVPVGDFSLWETDPFALQNKKGYFYGRGVEDMKGAVAAMLSAFLKVMQASQSKINGTLALLLTSDEEGPAIHGMHHVVQVLNDRGYYFDNCLIGEPTSKKILGDTLKIGRRGSLSVKIILYGKQGHVAYPHLVDNPVHCGAKVIYRLLSEDWGKFDDAQTAEKSFPPTSIQVTDFNVGNLVDNMVPSKAQIKVNFRFGSDHSEKRLLSRVEEILKEESGKDKYLLEWKVSAKPYRTSQESPFIGLVSKVVSETNNVVPEISLDGGTSDGRFLKDICNHVIELGVIHKTLHQVNEKTNIKDLVMLRDIYVQVIYKALCSSK